MLELRAISAPAELPAVRGGWEELLGRAPAANLFLTFEWLTTWWRHYGGNARLCLLGVYEGGELSGLAPLMIQERRLTGIPIYRSVSFLGTGISDRLDILLTAGRERAILETIVSHLRSQQWDMVDLQEIPEDSVTVKLLPELAEPLGAQVEVMPQSVCPVIKLKETPEAQFATLGKKLRRNIGAYGRRLKREHAVVVDFVKDGPAPTDDLQAFFRLYRKCFADRPSARQLIGDQFAAFRQEIATRFATQGRLLLALLRIDGTLAAGGLAFLYRGTCYWYNTCYDPAWQRESIGTLLHWEIMRHAITVGCHEFDYLRGDEAFKAHWGAQPRRHVRIRITRETPKLRVLRAGVHLARLRGRLVPTAWMRQSQRLRRPTVGEGIPQ